MVLHSRIRKQKIIASLAISANPFSSRTFVDGAVYDGRVASGGRLAAFAAPRPLS